MTKDADWKAVCIIRKGNETYEEYVCWKCHKDGYLSRCKVIAPLNDWPTHCSGNPKDYHGGVK